MRLQGVLVAMLLVGGCAEDKPAERRTTRTASDESQGSAADPSAVTPERQNAVERLFARKAGDLQSCWTEEYERTHNRKLEGDLTIQLVVAPSGKADDVKVIKSTLGNQDVESCVVKAVASWAFPEGSGAMPYNRTVHLGAQF
jgi:TonB family protein